MPEPVPASLLDAAFRLVAALPPGDGQDQGLRELARLHGSQPPSALRRAWRSALRLKKAAGELYSAFERGQMTALEAGGELRRRCPGFSPRVYENAWYDGWQLTRW